MGGGRGLAALCWSCVFPIIWESPREHASEMRWKLQESVGSVRARDPPRHPPWTVTSYREHVLGCWALASQHHPVASELGAVLRERCSAGT